MLLIAVKVSKCKLEPYEYAQIIFKRPAGSVHAESIINYLFYLLNCFPRGLEVDLEGSSAFLPLMLLMHIAILGLVVHLYGSIFNCITAYKGC